MGSVTDFPCIVTGGDGKADLSSCHLSDLGGCSNLCTPGTCCGMFDRDCRSYGSLTGFQAIGQAFAGSLFHERRQGWCGKHRQRPAFYRGSGIGILHRFAYNGGFPYQRMRTFLRLIVFCKDGIVSTVADPLFVSVCLSHGTFIMHAGFFHYISGMGVSYVMPGIDTIHTDFLKEEPDQFG